MSIEQLAAEQFDVFLSYTLPKTNSSPLKIGRMIRPKRIIFLWHHFFRGQPEKPTEVKTISVDRGSSRRLVRGSRFLKQDMAHLPFWGVV